MISKIYNVFVLDNNVAITEICLSLILFWRFYQSISIFYSYFLYFSNGCLALWTLFYVHLSGEIPRVPLMVSSIISVRPLVITVGPRRPAVVFGRVTAFSVLVAEITVVRITGSQR